ncbi:MAG: hypothetical protein ACWGMZ_01495 [Thermoguttaceae bacterium]
MKTTASTRIGWVILFALCAATATAGEAKNSATGATSVGKAANNRPDDKNKQATDLLRRARQAMAENDLTAAESLITQAESLKVEYSVFHLGDTPKKARRDLQRKLRAGAPTRPSQIFTPFMGKNKKASAKDPFVARGRAIPGIFPEPRQVMPLPRVGSSSATAQSSGGSALDALNANYPSTKPNEDDFQLSALFSKSPVRKNATGNNSDIASNHNYLLQARLALAVGDMHRAAEFLQRQKNQNLQYAPMDDSPEKVEAVMRKMQDIGSMEKNTEAYCRVYARNLLEQAEGLLVYNQWDEAERLANVAAMQRATYAANETKPQDVATRIANMRRRWDQNRTAMAGLNKPANPEHKAISGVNLHAQAAALVRQARDALAANHLDRAEQLAQKAQELSRSAGAYASDEDRPDLILSDVRQIRRRQGSAAVGLGTANAQQTVTRAIYDATNDPTHNVTVANNEKSTTTLKLRAAANNRQDKSQFPMAIPLPPTVASEQISSPEPMPNESFSGSALSLFQQGEAALKAQDHARAHQFFRQAARRMNELDPQTAQHLQDRMQLLAGVNYKANKGGESPTMLNETAARQQVLARQIAADLAHLEANVRATRETDPKGALALLEEGRKKVETAGLEPSARDQLLRRADRAIAETKQYIDQNRPRLELTEKNNRTRQELEREQHVKLQTQEKIALLVDQFNRLRDEQRYEEAQVVAKRAATLDPDNPVAQQLLTDAKFFFRVMSNAALQEQKENGFWASLDSVDHASVPFDDRTPYLMPDVKTWSELTKNRSKLAQAERRRNRSEREIEIEKKLKTPVSLDFTNAPLNKVVEYLSKISETNIYLDPKGLAEEGVTAETPINIEVRQEIMLKSALNLILQPLHLSYIVKDEVLKITSEQLRDNEVYTVSYPVADLVVPIPNFVPRSMGLSAAYQEAMGSVGVFGGANASFGSTTTPLAVVASRDGKEANGTINPNILAQLTSSSSSAIPGQGSQQPLGHGPGGLGGGTQADFDSLIQLITSTVKPTTWDTVGGPGSIAPFETNLSLVVSQTQEVHEEIVDLLEQLRRMQDLQVTIEVRFITLTDNFFERIGVDFDFKIHNNAKNQPSGFGSAVSGPDFSTTPPTEPTYNTLDASRNRSAVLGMASGPTLTTPAIYTSDLDIPFAQNSFGLAVPQFGGFDATAGAQLGFAILSDIEAYFFINAAQGDDRTNILQAPKVTLFNGQQAYVSDTSSSPFVISVIPVVGEFAAAHEPVIVVLSEGTFMTVQAVVSNDRRFVRLTVVPFFSKISDKDNTFTFTGSETTTTDTTRQGVQTTPNDNTKNVDTSSNTKSGVTVQLPTFSFVTVTTTVSVPDGGTVLLGGIKRLSEERIERGVPMLNKLPYLNRLFNNIGIGRDTQSLMMMVTPRIIIQEEEEEKLGVQ